jgi:hypothetical protein
MWLRLKWPMAKLTTIFPIKVKVARIGFSASPAQAKQQAKQLSACASSGKARIAK